MSQRIPVVELSSRDLKRNARQALGDTQLRGNMRSAMDSLMAKRLASMPDIERAPLLEWHRWLGTTAAGTTLVAALATLGGPRRLWLYRIALLAAGVLVGATGHLGGLLVFGPDFFRFRS